MALGKSAQQVTVEEVQQATIKELGSIIRKAFDADTALHTVASLGGPPGYDNGQLLARLLKDDHLVCRQIHLGTQLVGVFCLEELDPFTCELRLLCIDPTLHNQGIGETVWKQIERTFPYKKWQVETPQYSLRNQHFYLKKCGFKLAGQKKYGENIAIVFSKMSE